MSAFVEKGRQFPGASPATTVSTDITTTSDNWTTTSVVVRPTVTYRTVDVFARLRSLFPPQWASRSNASRLDAAFAGLADALSWIADLIVYARRQSRIGSATGMWLDIAAWDFFHSRLMRRRDEGDTSFSTRVVAEILRPRATRRAIAQALMDLTGNAPTIIEPWNPGDNGAWNRRMAYGGAAKPAIRVTGYNIPRSRYGAGTFAYVTPRPPEEGSAGVGHYGSLDMRAQLLVRVRRGTAGLLRVGPAGGYNLPHLVYGGSNPSPAEFACWNSARVGWNAPRFGYLRYAPPYLVTTGRGFYVASDSQARVTDAEIYATVAATQAAGVVAWTGIDP